MSRSISFALIVLLSAFVSANARSAEPSTLEQTLEKNRAELQRTFPARSDAEEFFLSFHLSPHRKYIIKDNDGRPKVHAKNHILLISWLSKDVGVAYEYSVSETGHVQSEVDMYNWSVRAVQVKELRKEQLKILQESISLLPRSATRPPISQTVYVSFQDKKDWRTEAYDSTKLPEEFEAVLKIIGERFETRGRKAPEEK